MKLLKAGTLIIGAMLATAFLAVAPAAAQSYTGCWLSGAAGGTVASTVASTEISAFGTSIDGLSQEGLAARGGAGCNMHLKDTSLVLGVGADYTYQNPEMNLAGFRAGLNNSWAVWGRVGIPVGKVMPYVLAGYVETEWDTNAGIPTDTLKGWMIGGGLDWQLSKQFTLGPEYRFIRYDEQTIGPAQIETDQHVFMVVGRFMLNDFLK